MALLIGTLGNLSDNIFFIFGILLQPPTKIISSNLLIFLFLASDITLSKGGINFSK